MADLRDIPDETRWRLAAEFSSRMPELYEAAFRPVAMGKYDEIEQDIWMELARTAPEIAKNLALPLKTPKEIAEAMRIVMTILFGPGFKNETLEIAKDRSVVVVKRCPFLSHVISGEEAEGVFRRCMAFTLTAVPLLNGQYSARFVRTICTGDRQCEIKVEAAPPAAKADAEKKK